MLPPKMSRAEPMVTLILRCPVSRIHSRSAKLPIPPAYVTGKLSISPDNSSAELPFFIPAKPSAVLVFVPSGMAVISVLESLFFPIASSAARRAPSARIGIRPRSTPCAFPSTSAAWIRNSSQYDESSVSASTVTSVSVNFCQRSVTI